MSFHEVRHRIAADARKIRATPTDPGWLVAARTGIARGTEGAP